MRRVLAALAVLLALGLPLRAQEAAVLLADTVRINADTTLIAEGNVEVFYEGARLRASRIVYDGAADRLTIEGPITLTDAAGVAIFADQAALSSDLQDGLLTSARLVLDQQLQLAAAEIARVGGRYTELSKVVASSCQVCPAAPVPLWSIRARRVIHDQETRQIYFEGAQFRIGRVPVAYIPRLRFPDPTLDRATGFLFPSVRTTSELGTGLKLPYFVTLGPSADVTLTPYLSPQTTTLEFRYRQAFRRGDITFEGAVSRDDIMPDETRYYLFGSGSFALPRDFRLAFGLQAVSDPAYLLDYDYSDDDRLESGVTVSRYRRDEAIEARVLHFRSIREGEDTATQPTLVAETRYERRLSPAAIGGTLTLGFGTLSTYRNSDLDGPGRDVERAEAVAAWQRSATFGPGLQLTGEARLTAQAHAVSDDSAFGNGVTRAVPEAGVTLRWPLIRTTGTGVTHLLEPVAMLAIAPDSIEAAPNEDSTLVEFDEGNLLSLSRYPGSDAFEEGVRLALGATWTRHDPLGWSMGVTVGRIFRAEADDLFGTGTGLDGDASDWMAAVSLDLPQRIDLTARALFDDSLDTSKAEVRLHYTGTRFDVETSFLYLAASPSEDRPEPAAEWTVGAGWRIDPNWTGRANWRYDIEADRAARAGLGFAYQNECIRVDLSLSRRFTSSTSVRPTTSAGLSVELVGFGSGIEGGAPRRRCVNY